MQKNNKTRGVFAVQGLIPAQADEEELLTAFAHLRILRLVNFNAFLGSLTELSGMDIVVLSTYESEVMHEKLAQLRRQGNMVTLHVLGGDAE